MSFKLLDWWLNVFFEEEIILGSFTSSNPVYPVKELSKLDGFARTVAKELERYEKTGVFECMKFKVDYSGCSEFDKTVYEELRKVPSGCLVTYKQLAERAGKPEAARAVGQSMKRNRFQIFVP